MTALVDLSRRNLPTSIPTSDSQISYDLENSSKCNEAALSTTITYVNGLPYPVHITDRNGLTKTLPSGNGSKVRTTNKLEIYYTHQFKTSVNFDPHHVLNGAYVAECQTLKLIQEKIAAHYSGKIPTRQRVCSFITVTVKYTISDEVFRLNDNDVYIHDIDTAVRSGAHDVDSSVIPTHPDSREGRMLRDLKRTDGFNLNMVINDPKKVFGERFVNILGTVYRIPVIEDPMQREGVHIYETTPSSIERYGTPMRKRVITFEQVADLEVFYPSQHQAQVLGDSSAAMKRELDEYKNKLANDTLERERIISDRKYEHEQWALAQKRLEDERKAQAEETKRVREERDQMRKEVFADGDYRRKMYAHQLDDELSVRSRIIAEDKYRQDRAKNESNALLDMLKWIPAAIGAVATMFLAFSKLMPSK